MMKSGALLDGADSLLARLAARSDDPRGAPRLLALFAHPDDEVLAVGGRLERFRDSTFLMATDGAPADGFDARDHGYGSLAEYRAARRLELEAALAHAGLPAAASRPLLLDDADPASQVADKDAMYCLPGLARAFLRELRACAPEAILTHPFEGGHPDHDSCAFAAHAAVALMGAGAPPVLEAPSYHAGPDGGIRTNVFLPAQIPVYAVALSAGEHTAKRARLACFRSQGRTLAQFGTETEQFRLAPAYDFTRAPHPGAPFFESFGWGVTGADFCYQARAALRELGLSGGTDPGECEVSDEEKDGRR